MRYLILVLISLIAANSVRAQSFIAVDSQSGRVLEAKAENEPRQIASLTKIATAVVALEWAMSHQIEPEDWRMRVPPSVKHLGGANPLGLKEGDTISLDTALYAALMASDNRSAAVIAKEVGKAIAPETRDDESVFVDQMNALAKRLGMVRTHFVNPHGLDAGDHSGVSTASDLAKLACFADNLKGFHRYCEEQTFQVMVFRDDNPMQITLRNTNELVGSRGIDGLKTGTTRKAGACLVISASRDSRDPLSEGRTDNRRVIIVLLGVDDRFREAVLLLNRTWAKP